MSGAGAFATYLAEIRGHPLLDREAEIELSRRIRAGDEAALDRLVTANLRFVVAVARRYAGRGVPLDELVNEGNVGLIRAARRFDESRGVRFASYAIWWIRQAVLGVVTRESRIVKVPSGRVDEARRVAAAARRLGQRLGRRPRPEEVAAEMGISERRVREALTVRRTDISLDASATKSDDACMLDLLPDAKGVDAARRVDREALNEALEHGLSRLPERDADVVRRYYGLGGTEPATLTEIGSALGVSRERVGVIRQRALARLRLGSAGRDLQNFRSD